MCDDSRNAHQLELGTCPMCGDVFPIDGRSIYCTPACRQRAFRLRHRPENRQALTALVTTLPRQQRLTDQTVYECQRALNASSAKDVAATVISCAARWVSEVNAPAALKSSPSPISSAQTWKEVLQPNPRHLAGGNANFHTS